MDALGLIQSLASQNNGTATELFCGSGTSTLTITTTSGPSWSVTVKSPIKAIILWVTCESTLTIDFSLDPIIIMHNTTSLTPTGIHDKCNLILSFTTGGTSINFDIRKSAGSTSGSTSYLTYFGYILT